MLKRRVRLALEPLEFELQLNLENNYKDLAKEAFLAYVAEVKRFYDAGEIKEKDFLKLQDKISDLALMFETYHH